MQFLHPNFLWALLFLAIPLIIHLFYFRRYKKVLFSNTKFLSELKDEQATKNKLKHLLVLLSRMLAILFLVLAFAQPYLSSNQDTSASNNLVGVYLDNSFSMQTEGEGYLLFEEAKTVAQKIIEAYSENNKFQVLTNDFEAKHQRIVSKSEALNMLSEIKISSASQAKELVYEKQKNASKKFEGQRILYQLSDFQLNNGNPKADQETQLNLVQFEASNIRNVSIDEVWFDSPVQLLNQNNKLLVKLSNQSSEEQTGSIQLSLNGEAKSIGNYTLKPFGYIIDTIQFTITKEEWNKGKISINDYPLIFDDDYYFSFFVEKQLSVYCIYEGSGGFYPKAVFTGTKEVDYSSNVFTQVDYNKINEQHLVVVSNLKSISSGLTSELKKYINSGGQVLFIPNGEVSASAYNQFLSSLGVGSYNQLIKESRQVATLHIEHTVLNDIFDETPTNINLPIAKQYFQLSRSAQQEHILSFADGSSYLSSASIGNGNIYLLNSPLGEAYSNFSQQAIFAPICYKMAVLGAKNIDIAYTIEANTNIVLSKTPKNTESLFKISNENQEFIPNNSVYNGLLMLNLPGNELRSDYYTVSNDDSDYKAEIALNYNRNESKLEFYSLNELKELYSGTGVNVLENNLAVINENVKLLEDGKSFWKLCIILALIFLAIEILLLRFLPN